MVDVIPEEIPKLPLVREAELAIAVLPNTAPTSRMPCQMTSFEFQVLKSQLQELFERGFIHLSLMPPNASVLLVKNEDDGIRMHVDYSVLAHP